MDVRNISNPVLEAHRKTRVEIPQVPHSELQLRLVVFSLREIDRAKSRINQIPNLSPSEARDLYYRLLRPFVVEHGKPDCAQARLRMAA